GPHGVDLRGREGLVAGAEGAGSRMAAGAAGVEVRRPRRAPWRDDRGLSVDRIAAQRATLVDRSLRRHSPLLSPVGYAVSSEASRSSLASSSLRRYNSRASRRPSWLSSMTAAISRQRQMSFFRWRRL